MGRQGVFVFLSDKPNSLTPPRPSDLTMTTAPEKLIHAPSHTRRAFDVFELPEIVRKVEQAIYRLKPDAIAACGHSGLLVAGAVSFITRIPIMAVRKPSESPVASSEWRVTAVLPGGPAKRWVWLDDFIGSGGTCVRSAAQLFYEKVVSTPFPIATIEYETFVDGYYAQHGNHYLAPDIVSRLERAHSIPWHRDIPDVIPCVGLKERD